MAKKQDIPQDNNILPVPLEEAMPDNYLPYAVEVARDRALPDVRDGLKPVHRRILYGAYMLKAFPDKPYYKSARIVGDILGKYHPHGDTSVYDAMVILAQNFSTRMPLIDGHGNWGSQDGDSAAAMRYTEARLASLSMEMLRDIDKEVVDMMDNYSGSEKEPVVLPSRYPNLLVNGTFGIAVGLATNIPPHNLGEVIDGVLAVSEKKDITTKELMNHIKGPDLPTGGILIGENALEAAYDTGVGKVTLRAKTKIEKLENGRYGIVITEFPYRKNKAKTLQTISHMTGEKKHAKVLDSISDIRDESDRKGIRSVIEFKKSCDKDMVDKVLKYLYKKTDLQVNLSFNMVALVKGKPETLGLKSILVHYLDHQKEVVTRRTRRELEIAERRFHIVEGFIKAISIMDEVIKTIRASKSKKDASVNLVNEFGFTEIQAEAILELMLYRLTGLEIKTFEKEHKELEKLIKKLRNILSSERELLKVIRAELIEIKEKYGDERRTEIIEDDSEAKIDVEELIIEEDTVITLSQDGFIKRIATKSYIRSSTNAEDIDYREGDYMKFSLESNTKDTVLFFTDSGNMYQVKGVDIPETKWKDKGEWIDSVIKGIDLSSENIIAAHSIPDMTAQKEFMLFTNRGTFKKTPLSEFNKTYSKLSALKLRDNEKLLDVKLIDNTREEQFLKFTTEQGLVITTEEPAIEPSNRNTTTTEVITISNKDEVISVEITEEYEYKTFPVSINQKGILKEVLGRNTDLRTYVSSRSIINIFTESGKIYCIPAFMVQNIGGEGIDITKLIDDFDVKEKIVKLSYSDEFSDHMMLYTMTMKGVIRRCKLTEVATTQLNTLDTKLKSKDSLVSVEIENEEANKDVLLITKKGLGIRFDSESVSVMKKSAVGVIGISLKEDDEVIFGSLIHKQGEEGENAKLTLTSNNGETAEIPIKDITSQNRAGRGKNLIVLEMNDYVKDVKIK